MKAARASTKKKSFAKRMMKLRTGIEMAGARKQFEQALLVERVAASVKTAATMNFQAELGVAIRKARAQITQLEREARGEILRKLGSVLDEQGMLLHTNKTMVTYEDGSVTGFIGILDMSKEFGEDVLRQVLAKKAKIQVTRIERGINWWLCYF